MSKGCRRDFCQEFEPNVARLDVADDSDRLKRGSQASLGLRPKHPINVNETMKLPVMAAAAKRTGSNTNQNTEEITRAFLVCVRWLITRQ